MPTCLNRAVKHSSVALINALQAYMSQKVSADFTAIRNDVPQLQSFTDAELAQVIADAGLDTEEDR